MRGPPPVGRAVQQGWVGRNANLHSGTRRVGLTCSGRSGSLAALVENTPRVSSHVNTPRCENHNSTRVDDS